MTIRQRWTLLSVTLFLLLLLAEMVSAAPIIVRQQLPQHPQIHAYNSFVAVEPDDGQRYVVVEATLVMDGKLWSPAGQIEGDCLENVTVQWRSLAPPAGFTTQITHRSGKPCASDWQERRFIDYVQRALSCDQSAELDQYINPLSHNPDSPMSLVAFASDISQLRNQPPFLCGLPHVEPTPPDYCWNLGAPIIDEYEPIDSEHFSVTIELDNGAAPTISFERNGGSWMITSVSGDADHCQGQLNNFNNFSLNTLNSPSCEANTFYDEDETATLQWYIDMLELRCHVEA